MVYGDLILVANDGQVDGDLRAEIGSAATGTVSILLKRMKRRLSGAPFSRSTPYLALLLFCKAFNWS